MSARTLLVIFAIVATPAAATVFPVTDSDELITAIDIANSTAGADIITLERGLFVVTRAHAESHQAALPEIKTPIVIRGNGSELRRYSNDDFRLIHVAEGGHLRLEGLVLAEGSLGAIRNHGVAELRRVTLVDSTARGAQAIVENYGEMRIDHSQLSFNTLAGAARDAGTIINWGTLSLTSTTFQGNRLSRRFDGVALASTLLNYGTADIHDIVIAENIAGDEDANGAPQAPLVNLGNGRLTLKLVREHDNSPGDALVARAL